MEDKELQEIRESFKENEKEANIKSFYRASEGLSEERVKELSEDKNEPEWMLNFRLNSLDTFFKKPLPTWGPELNLELDKISYYVKPLPDQEKSFDDLPEQIKSTYDALGVPRAEAEALAGVSNQWDSEVVYHELKKELEEQGIIFLDMDSALKEHEEIFRDHFATVIPAADNKFAALNSAFWSGGSFVYVPKGVKVERPLQTYFRINSQAMLQAERTLIIAEEGATVSYIEGCFPAGELVSLGDTMVEIESLKPGDSPVNENGNPTLISKTFARPYNGEIIEVTPLSPENKFSLTPNHPVKAVKRTSVAKSKVPSAPPHWQTNIDNKKLLKSDPSWVEASDLKEGDFIVFPKIIPPKNKKLEEKFSNELLTILGYYLAEGHLTLIQKKYKAVSFSFNKKEKALYQELMKRSKELFGTEGSVTIIDSKNEAKVLIYSDQLYDLCKKHCSSGSAQKKLSPELMSLSTKKLNYLLRSYLLGDGSLGRRKTAKGETVMVRATTVSRTLVFQIQELLARQGIYAHIQKRKGGPDIIQGRSIVRKDQYSIGFTKNTRWSAVRDCGDYFLVPIKKINRKEYSGAVFNLECQKPNSYLVKGFAVHNCSAPQFQGTDSIHAAVVEVIAKENSDVSYFTVQNWDPKNVYNLVTKRARAEANSTVRWIQGELGSKTNMKYPSVYLVGEGSHAEILSVAWAGQGQNQDTGAKAVHLAPNTSSNITSKSISTNGGVASYRGLLEIAKGAIGSRSRVVCDALILDDKSTSNTWPTIRVHEKTADIGHEATVSKVGDEQIFYLMSHGLSESEAQSIIVNGFLEPIIKELPLEYAVEMNRLVDLEMEGSIG
jgi:Fe-S cluster assembly protein SufB